MSLSTTEITQTFTDPTSGQPVSNINVSFAVSQVLYIGGIPTVSPASPVACEVVGGQLQLASGAPVTLADEGNAVTLMSGTGFWWWTVTITGDITDSWSFQLPHSATPVELYSTKNTGGGGGGGGSQYQAWQFHVAISGSDDSANLIAAMNSAVTYAAAHAGYAEVVLDPGVYQCNAAPTIGGATAGNAILPLPVVAATAQKVVLRIRGANPWGADALAHWQQTVPELPGTVLQTTRTDGTNDVSNGPAYILGGPFNGYGAGTSLFSNMLIILDGVRAVAPWNGTYGGFGFTGVAEMRVISGGFSAYAVVPSGTSYQQFATGGPTVNQWTTGLATPDVNNNALSDILFWSAEGAAIGALLSDHTEVLSMRTIYCNAGIQAGSPSGSPGAHGITMDKLTCEYSGSAVVGLSPAKIDIGEIDIEEVTNIIYDPRNYLTGRAGARINGTPGYGTFTVNGGSNYRLTALDIQPGAVTAPGVPSASTNFPNLFYAGATVRISGGTGVSPTVDGMAVPVGTPFHVRTNGVINLGAYSVAPTWAWVLD